jgi:Amt family ammonium transporter
LHSVGDGVLTVDRNGLVTYINPAAETVTGLSLRDVVGKSVSESLVLTDEAADGQPVDLAAIFKDVREALTVPGELVLHSLCVTSVSVDVTISPLLYLPGTEIDGYVVTLHDVTSSRRIARDLSHQALHDPLTGLLNRRGFETRLHQALEQKLHDSVAHCLCYIDLDRFKAVNDTCGHQGGDELLKQIVGLMHSRIRDADAFARLGGDEFAILLRGCPLERAINVAESICEAVAAYRFQWEGNEFSIGASIGVVPMIQNDSLKSISEAADNVCYQAKETGRGRVCVDARETARA